MCRWPGWVACAYILIITVLSSCLLTVFFKFDVTPLLWNEIGTGSTVSLFHYLWWDFFTSSSMVLCWANENLVHSVIYNVFVVLSWQEFSHSCSQYLAETFSNPHEQARDGLTDFFQGSKDSVMAKGLKYEQKKKSFSKSGNRNSRSWFIIMTGNVDWDAGHYKQLNFSKKKKKEVAAGMLQLVTGSENFKKETADCAQQKWKWNACPAYGCNT